MTNDQRPTTSDQRLTSWDVARGMAMLLVILYHVPLYIRICHPEAAELLAPHIELGTYILPFFMPVFFVISGYFTDTSKPYGRFLWGDIKHLLLFGLLLQFVNIMIQVIGLRAPGHLWWFLRELFSLHCLDILFSQWFISAIFFARQIYYWVNRLASYTVHRTPYTVHLIFLLSLVAIAGVLLEPYAPHNSQWFYCQGLVFAIFLAVGRLLYTVHRTPYTIHRTPYTVHLLSLGSLYIILMVVAKLTGLSTLEYGMMNNSFTLAHWPFYMVLALTGSALLIGLAQLINRCPPLEFIGRHTLVFYIPQGGLLYVFSKRLGQVLQPDTPARVWLFILILWAATLLSLSALAACETIIRNKIKQKQQSKQLQQ